MEEYKKILKNSKILLVISIIMILVSIILTVFTDCLDSKIPEELVSKDYNQLIALEQDTNNEYVHLTIVDIPYELATYETDTSTETYYFAFDENDYVYIIRLTDNTYKKLEIMYNENPEEFSYQLKGYIFNLDPELKKIAIDSFNQSMGEEIITEENFRQYIGATYLDETITPYTEIQAVLVGVAIGIFGIAIVFFTIYIVGVIKTKKTLKNYSKDDLEYELSKNTCISHKKSNIYLTDKYIISKVIGLTVLEYNQLVWVYNEIRKQNGITIGTFLVGFTDKNKKYQLADTYKNEKLLNEIMFKIKEKNPNIMIGFTTENEQKYKEIKKNK